MRDAQREATRCCARTSAETTRRGAAQRRSVHGEPASVTTRWLLLLPALVLLVAFTHWPALATLWHSFFSTPKRGAARGLRRPRQLPRDGRGPDVLAGALEQRLVRARHDPAVDRARAAMALWVNSRLTGTRLPAPGLLHADGAADDRGREHLAVLLHAAVRAARADHRRARLAEPQLARRALTVLGADRRRDLEGGRLLHDLLPGRAAADLADLGRGGRDRGRVALAVLPPRACFRC